MTLHVGRHLAQLYLTEPVLKDDPEGTETAEQLLDHFSYVAEEMVRLLRIYLF